MNILVLYFILANLGLAAFYLFFRLLLQKDTFFAGKRIALLVGIMLALTYPLLDLSGWIQRSDSLVAYADVLRERLPEIPATMVALENTATLENGVIPASVVEPNVEASPINVAPPTNESAALTSMGVQTEMGNGVLESAKTFSLTVFDYLLLIYFLTTAFLFFRIARQLIRIQNCRKHAERRELHGQWVYVLKGCLSPFSFFNAVFMDPDVYSDKNQLEIIEHEKAHIKQGHSYDVVFSELVCALFWINPFAWLLKRSLRENLEFLADLDVLKKGVDPKTYQYKLLQLSCHRSDANLANHFNVSQLKKRIVMMNKKRTSWKGLGKYALYLPLFAALLLTAYAWGQQHETEAKALVERATADSKVVEAQITTIDNAAALAQNVTKEKPADLAQNTSGVQAVERPNIADYIGPQTTWNINGVVYRIIDDKNMEVVISRSSTFESEMRFADIQYTITSIGQNAFSDNPDLQKVTIPSTITLIDNQAFMNCSGLTSISLPASLKKIGSEAFRGCSNLAAITIPASVTSIGEKAFHDCTGLKQLTVEENNAQFASVDGVLFNKRKVWLIAYPYNTSTHYTIPSFVKVIGLRAFSDCTGLTSITIPSSVTGIYQDAFRGCTGLTSITIPSSVTGIMTGAFKGCTGLTSVSLPPSVETIEYETFKGCTGLTSITIPASVKTIESFAFEGCTALTSVTIPATTESIRDEAFKGCTALKQINVDPKNPVYDSFEGKLVRKVKLSPTDKPLTLAFQVKGFNFKTTSANSVELASGGVYAGDIVIPSTVEYSGNTYQVTSIGASAFSNCPKLTSVNIPASVSTITGSGLGSSLESIHITVDDKNPYFISIDDVVYDKNKTTLVVCRGKKSQFVIPSTVTNIETYAFSNCRSLTSLVIPSSVTSIGNGAFGYCSGLTSLVIPSSVTSIGAQAFGYCKGLTSLVIPSSIKTIQSSTFSNCTGLTSLVIPSSVTSIGAQAFSFCTGLTSLPLPSLVTKIESFTFRGCTGLTTVTIPPSITSIQNSAFLDCSNLTSVTLSENVSKIEGAFSNCTALKQFNVVGNNLYFSSLDGVLFNKDKSVLIAFPMKHKANQYAIPSSVTSIGNSAFNNCEDLTSITIPSSVTTIGDRAFSGCSSLKAMVLPSSVKSIGKIAFQGCSIEKYSVDGKNPTYSSLDGVLFNKDRTTLIACPVSKSSQFTIPSTVTSIGDYAFSSCYSLTAIIIPSSVTTIGSSAFFSCAGLTSLILPSSVTTIGSGAFNGCFKLLSITIPSSVTSIGRGAFESSRLNEIHCQLKQPLVTNAVFAEVKNYTKLYVPKGSKELYANAPEWGEFPTILEE